ncbi:uncharacterized protein LOC135177805 [Pogoniulus pusillus]|uniref:uncharacterized protein LOC135177805 n=1 Tax=Pogoniulus pusillus TaxID=488313 RepID=UPI0030B93156
MANGSALAGPACAEVASTERVEVAAAKRKGREWRRHLEELSREEDERASVNVLRQQVQHSQLVLQCGHLFPHNPLDLVQHQRMVEWEKGEKAGPRILYTKIHFCDRQRFCYTNLLLNYSARDDRDLPWRCLAPGRGVPSRSWWCRTGPARSAAARQRRRLRPPHPSCRCPPAPAAAPSAAGRTPLLGDRHRSARRRPARAEAAHGQPKGGVQGRADTAPRLPQPRADPPPQLLPGPVSAAAADALIAMAASRNVMRAVRVFEFGGPDVLKLQSDVLIPSPKAQQVLIKVHACGVNPVETYIRSGTYARKPALPYTPGTDVAGAIETVGEQVTAFKRACQGRGDGAGAWCQWRNLKEWENNL